MQDVVLVIRSVVLALAALLPIINPLGSAPMFLSMTPGASSEARAALAARIAWNSAILLISAMLVGSYVLKFFGLSLAVIKLAGGLLVIATGWRLLRSDDHPDASMVPAAPVWGSAEIARQGFFPLAFPLTIGPGSVSVAITLGAGTQGEHAAPIFAVAGSILGIIIVGAAIYFAYRYATRLLDMIGTTGTVVVLRLSAFILLSVGVQIFCDGLAERFAVLR